MIYNDSFLDKIKELTGKAYYNGNKTNIITFCPKCETKKFFTSAPHGHLYIDTTSPIFHCFKCGFKGIVTKFVKELSINIKEILLDESIIENINQYKKTVKTFDNIDYTYSKNNIKNENLKILYLKGRLGFDFNIEKIPRLVLNIKEFMIQNNIELDDYQMRLLDYYDHNFVGFVTSRGTSMVIRNITSESDIRYARLPLVDFSANIFSDFYGIITRNPLQKMNTIVLCEGIFDLLNSIQSNFFKEIFDQSCCWVSVLKNRYSPLIYSVLDYNKISKAHIVVLSDNEYKDENINIEEKERIDYYMLKNSPFVESVKIYKNKLDKDFGSNKVYPIETVFNRRSGYAENKRSSFCKFK